MNVKTIIYIQRWWKKINKHIFLINMIQHSIYLYKQYGGRSNKKVNYLHEQLIIYLKKYFFSKQLYYKVEQNIICNNSNGKKRCDIIAYNNQESYFFPVKFIMSNFKQNKNNYLENLVGEVYLIKQKNPYLKCIPINILQTNTPYKKRNGNTIYYEKLTIKDYVPYITLCKSLFDHIIIIIYDNINNTIKRIIQ